MSSADGNEEQAESPPVFSCSAPDLRPLATILSTVHFSPRVVIEISHSAIHVEAEIGKILKARAYLEKTAFTDWIFNPPPITNTQRDVSTRRRRSSSQAAMGEDEEEQEEQEGENTDDVRFEISMTSLMECLNIFGTAISQKSHKKNLVDNDLDADAGGGANRFPENGRRPPARSRRQPASAVRISYDGYGHPLVLVIEDSGVVTRCSLMTYEADDTTQMEFPIDRQLVHLIMKSDWLKSAFSQFDDKSGSEITFIFSPPPPSIPRQLNANVGGQHLSGFPDGLQSRAITRPTFRLQVDGEFGCYTIDFPNDRDILDNFQCQLPEGLDPQDLDRIGFVRNSYKLSHILKMKKALDVSSKTSLRVDDTGLLNFQLLIPLDESTTLRQRSGYVEFMCIPLEDG